MTDDGAQQSLLLTAGHLDEQLLSRANVGGGNRLLVGVYCLQGRSSVTCEREMVKMENMGGKNKMNVRTKKKKNENRIKKNKQKKHY